MRHGIRLEQAYPFPPERVWRVLTDRDLLAQWLMPNDFEPAVGHRFQFRSQPMPGWRGFVECEVLEVVPPRLLAYTWVGDADWKEPTVVRWTLEPIEGGTKVVLQHTNLQDPWGAALKAMLGQGWKKMLELKLADVLQHGEGEA
ncbi:MAG TPA: SRPBCC domain-containing protein [Candidatus Polarisedimenticolaceae bacterium]|nr:SRPBCC domain-containing protein [Candidatus Polarisedimenticolaceae bacterium]